MLQNNDSPSVFGGFRPLVPLSGLCPGFASWYPYQGLGPAGDLSGPQTPREFRPQTQNPESATESSNNYNILLHLNKREFICHNVVYYHCLLTNKIKNIS